MVLSSSLEPDAYSYYSQIYDAYKGDRSNTVKLISNLIKQHKAKATTALELACGTGAILQGLQGDYDLTGLDQSPAMLKIAKRKLPGVQLIKANMVSFDLRKKFDVIYCVHNSVNHILELEDLDKMFKHVHAHLNKGGIFIFDINTPERLEQLTQAPPHLTCVADNYLITEVKKLNKNQYHWDLKVILKHKSRFVLKRKLIKVAAYPLDDVICLLQVNFKLEDSVSLTSTPEEKGRVYLVFSKGTEQIRRVGDQGLV